MNIMCLNHPVQIFTADNGVLYVGNELNFTTITVSLTIPSSANIDAVYYYCNNSGVWKSLTSAVSTTNGFQNSGGIVFTNPLDRGKCNKQINGTLFSEPTNYSYIAIQRTKNNVVVPPTVDLITISGASINMFLKQDMMRLSPADTAPEICTGTILGAIYYDISEDDMCVCKTTGWKVMTDNTVCT